MMVKMFFPLFEKDGIKVLRKSIGGSGIYTFEEIVGQMTYVEWDDRYLEKRDIERQIEGVETWSKFGQSLPMPERLEQEVKCPGYKPFVDTYVDNKSIWIHGFPKKEEKRSSVHATRHLFTLLDYCEQANIPFTDESGGYLGKIIDIGWENELKNSMTEEEKKRYLEHLTVL